MIGLSALIKRNIKLYFRDKGMFFSSLITPISVARRDLTLSPLHLSSLGFSYYLAALISTLIINLTAAAVSLAYLAFVGWYLSSADVLLLILDVFLLTIYNVRHCPFLVRQFLFEQRRSGIGCRHHCQRRLRIYMRCIYACFKFLACASENSFLSARYIRHRSFNKSCNARRLPADDKRRYSAGNN